MKRELRKKAKKSKQKKAKTKLIKPKTQGENDGKSQSQGVIDDSALEILDRLKLQSVKNLAMKVKSGKPLSSRDLQTLKSIKIDLERRKEKVPRQSEETEIVDTIPDVAERLGRAPRTVDYWVKEGMPRCGDGRYDLKAIREWRAQKDADFGLDDNGVSPTHWKMLYLEMKARLAELEYKKEIGELLPKDDVDQGRVARVMMIKRALLALPKIVAPQLAGLKPREVEAVLRSRLEETIQRFAKG